MLPCMHYHISQTKLETSSKLPLFLLSLCPALLLKLFEHYNFWEMNLDHLPEDCFAHILSFTSPGDACRCSLVSWSFRTMADLDSVWEKFLPSDHAEILSRLVCPITYSSNKELFIRLCSRNLIDGSKKVNFQLLFAFNLILKWQRHN